MTNTCYFFRIFLWIFIFSISIVFNFNSGGAIRVTPTVGCGTPSIKQEHTTAIQIILPIQYSNLPQAMHVQDGAIILPVSQYMNHHLPSNISYHHIWQICTSWQIANHQQHSSMFELNCWNIVWMCRGTSVKWSHLARKCSLIFNDSTILWKLLWQLVNFTS